MGNFDNLMREEMSVIVMYFMFHALFLLQDTNMNNNFCPLENSLNLIHGLNNSGVILDSFLFM